MTLGFPRKELPVSEGNKLSLNVKEDYPGPEGCVLCFCFSMLCRLLKVAYFTFH